MSAPIEKTAAADLAKGEFIASVSNLILTALEKQAFTDWHATRFEAFITGDLKVLGTQSHSVARTLILQDIQHLFNLR